MRVCIHGRIRASAGLLLLLAAGHARAHDGIHEQLAVISRLIAAEPTRASLYLERAELYRVHRDWTSATTDYERARELDPALAGVESARIQMLVDARRLTAAEAAITAWLAEQPTDARVVFLAGEVLALQGRFREAVDAYTRALARSVTRVPEQYLARAAVQRRTGPDGLALALAGLDDGIAHIGPLVTLQLAAIELEIELGHHDRALERVEVLRAAARRQETWLARRGDILSSAGRGSEAAAAYREALEHIRALKPRRRGTKTVRELVLHVQERLASLDSNHE